LAPPALAQGRLIGYLVDSASRQRISSVEILISQQRTTITSNENGEFILRDLGAGPNTLFFRRIGYRPRALEISMGERDSLEIEVEMTPMAYVIRDLSVTGRAKPFIGAGRYFGPEQLRSRGREPIANLVLGIPGLRAAGPVIISHRGWNNLGPSARPCALSLWVDGVPLQDYSELIEYTTDRIYSMEVYQGIASTPIEYSMTGMSPCGAIVIWTRPESR
jgi:hypothetical protein